MTLLLGEFGKFIIIEAGKIGLALMLVLDLFPAGILQLWDVLTNGYRHAGRYFSIVSGVFPAVEWIRIVGDLHCTAHWLPRVCFLGFV